MLHSLVLEEKNVEFGDFPYCIHCLSSHCTCVQFPVEISLLRSHVRHDNIYFLNLRHSVVIISEMILTYQIFALLAVDQHNVIV